MDSKRPTNETLAELRRFTARTLKQIGNGVASLPTLQRRLATSTPVIQFELVSSARIQSLNSRYRKKNQPTDILSFPAPEIFRQQGVLGELIVSLPVARAQARTQGHSIRQELLVLLVHGYLHLLDFDHERNANEAKAMARWEAKLLTLLGKPESSPGVAPARRTKKRLAHSPTKGLITRSQFS